MLACRNTGRHEPGSAVVVGETHELLALRGSLDQPKWSAGELADLRPRLSSPEILPSHRPPCTRFNMHSMCRSKVLSASPPFYVTSWWRKSDQQMRPDRDRVVQTRAKACMHAKRWEHGAGVGRAKHLCALQGYTTRCFSTPPFEGYVLLLHRHNKETFMEYTSL